MSEVTSSVLVSFGTKKLKPDKFFMGKPSQNYTVMCMYIA